MTKAMSKDKKGWPECEHCRQRINPKTAVWLELSVKKGTWHKDGELPEEDSQGFFQFGAACAKTILKNGGRQP